MRRISKLQAQAEPIEDLRQFMYLDDTALRSLWVSRYGPEAVRIVEREERSREAEVNTSAEHSIPTLAKLRAEGRMRTSNTRGREVERVASMQSLYRDFILAERRATKFEALWDGTGPEATAPKSLERGDLLLVRVRLAADLWYRIASFAESMADLQEIGGGTFDRIENVTEVADLLDRTMIGQVPLASELVDWAWDEANQQIVPAGENTSPLVLAALTDLRLYWVDVRRIMFENAECTALVRVAEGSPTASWSPIKMFDAVADLPGLETITASLQQLRDQFTQVSTTELSHSSLALSAAAYAYWTACASSEPSAAVSTQIDTIIAAAEDTGSAAGVDAVFRKVDDLLEVAGANRPEANTAARLRAAALADTADRDSSPQTDPHRVDDQHFVVGEVIAISW